MKQKVLIILGSIVLGLLIAFGIYLFFFYGAEQDQFTNLGPEGQTDGGVVISPEPTVPTTTTTTTVRPRLRQLTTKPVIGFVEVSTSSVRFAEAGTGHIFTVDTETGEEVRISNTTVIEASMASFSPTGNVVALRAQNDRRTSPITIGEITDGSLTVTELNKDVFDFSLSSETDLFYTQRTSEGLEGRHYSIPNKNDTQLFSVPFYEASIQFGNTATSTHYAYPKPAHTLEGYAYSFTRGRMKREPIQGFGLNIFSTPGHISYTHTTNQQPRSYILSDSTQEIVDSPVIIIPEKCTPGFETATMWCAYQAKSLPVDFPDSWYSGSLSFADSIWEISLESGTAFSVVNTFTESLREIDIISMQSGSSHTALYFINKNDNTLWMYEL